MNLELSAGQRDARAEFHAFTAAEIAPHADGWDRAGAIPAELNGRKKWITFGQIAGLFLAFDAKVTEIFEGSTQIQQITIPLFEFQEL